MKSINPSRRGLIPFLSAIALFILSSSFSNAQTLRQDVLKYTNEFRQSKGLPALEMRDNLNSIAVEHSSNMAKGSTRFGHDGFQQRQQAVHKLFPSVNGFAENVAYGATSGKEVVNMWKKSSGHRRNMLGNYKYIGIGIASDGRGNIYYTQLFVN